MNITFGIMGTATRLVSCGIDFTDSGDFSWTTSPFVELEVRLPPARDNLQIEIETGAFTANSLSYQSLFLYLGGLFIAHWRIDNYCLLTSRAPRAALTGRPCKLALALPNATSPKTLKISDDQRELGLHLRRINFKIEE